MKIVLSETFLVGHNESWQNNLINCKISAAVDGDGWWCHPGIVGQQSTEPCTTSSYLSVALGAKTG